VQPGPSLLLIVIVTGALFLFLLLLAIVIVVLRRRSTSRRQAATSMPPPAEPAASPWASSYPAPAQPAWQPPAPSTPSAFTGPATTGFGADQATSVAGAASQEAGEETEAAGPAGFGAPAAPFGAAGAPFGTAGPAVPPSQAQPPAAPAFGSFSEAPRPFEAPATPFGQPAPAPAPSPSPFGPPPSSSPFGPPPPAQPAARAAEAQDEAVEKTVVRPRLPKLTYIGLLIDRKQPSRRYDVDKVNNTIGRSPSNTIVLDDPTVSRQHATIKIEGNEFVLADLGSSNGTFIGDERLSQPTPLKDGTLVRFGDVELTFKLISLE